jgi:outer membrane biosynthesis protein TonB
MTAAARRSLTFVMRPGDERPPSLLDRRGLDARMTFGGVVLVLTAHVIVPGAIVGTLALLAAAGAGATPPRVINEEHVVEARFVKLGKKLDPKKIPNRKVPIKTTAPQPGVAVSKVMEPPKPKQEPKPPPEQAEEDLLTRLGDRAQAFSEIAEKQEQEGDPNGIEEGTETTGRAGDIYLGQVAAFFKRGWTVPTTLADPSGLTTKVSIEITPDRKVGPHSVIKSSGVALFDQSVEDRINALRVQASTLPEPPPEIADKYASAWTLSINFNGREAR